MSVPTQKHVVTSQKEILEQGVKNISVKMEVLPFSPFINPKLCDL